MNRSMLVLALWTLSLVAIAGDEPVLEAIQEYLEFAEYSDGAIRPQQLESIDAGQVLYIDVRDAVRYRAGHIPGASNIEWRQILERRDEIPGNGTVVLYCDTGLSSSKASFILRLSGKDNVKVLRGGYRLWQSSRKGQ